MISAVRSAFGAGTISESCTGSTAIPCDWQCWTARRVMSASIFMRLTPASEQKMSETCRCLAITASSSLDALCLLIFNSSEIAAIAPSLLLTLIPMLNAFLPHARGNSPVS